MSARTKELLEKLLALSAKERSQLLKALRAQANDDDAEEAAGLPHEDPEFAAELRRRAAEAEARWNEAIPYEQLRERLGRGDD